MCEWVWRVQKSRAQRLSKTIVWAARQKVGPKLVCAYVLHILPQATSFSIPHSKSEIDRKHPRVSIALSSDVEKSKFLYGHARGRSAYT
jgi:hypothetical protein